MDVRLIPEKIKQRLNKADSFDYDNIPCWQFIEAYNKAQIEWVRRQIDGVNQKREGDEVTKMKVDDLQILLTSEKLLGKTHKIYFESLGLPENYLYFKRVTPIVSKGECIDIPLDICHLREEANVGEYLTNPNYKPSFDWRETFCTLISNNLRVYTNGDFKVSTVEMIYYRVPRAIDLDGCEAITGLIGKNVNPEFKDDIVELIIDDAASILAGDIESLNAEQRTKQRAETNN